MKDSEALEVAAAIVEGGYCKEAYARNIELKRVGVMDPTATTFDLIGSVCRALGGSILAADRIVDEWVLPLLPRRFAPLGGGRLGGLAEKAPQVREFNVSPRAWSDLLGTTQAHVVAKLHEASKRAKEKGN